MEDLRTARVDSTGGKNSESTKDRVQGNYSSLEPLLFSLLIVACGAFSLWVIL